MDFSNPELAKIAAETEKTDEELRIRLDSISNDIRYFEKLCNDRGYKREVRVDEGGDRLTWGEWSRKAGWRVIYQDLNDRAGFDNVRPFQETPSAVRLRAVHMLIPLLKKLSGNL